MSGLNKMKIKKVKSSKPFYQSIIVICLVILFSITACSNPVLYKDDLRFPVGLTVSLDGLGKTIHVGDIFDVKIRVYVENNVFAYRDTLAENGNEASILVTMDSLYVEINNSKSKSVFEFVTDSTRLLTPIAKGDSLIFNVTLKAISSGWHSLKVEAYFFDENWMYSYNETGDIRPYFIWREDIIVNVE